MAGLGATWIGTVRDGRQGTARNGGERIGAAGGARLGKEWNGTAREGRRG